MIKHKRILVPVALASDPEHAFERALELAQRSGAELYLLHAVPLHQPYGLRAKQRLRRFADLRRRAEAVGVRVQTVEQPGNATGVIVLHANARQVDLIVMTSSRRTGWARLRKPSLAESVLHRTTRPTLIVRDGDTGAFSNVLAAVDLSAESAQMINRAIALPGIDARNLAVVHAVEQLEAADAFHSPGRWKVGEYRRYVIDDARRDAAAMMQGVETTANIDLRVSGGSIDEVIGKHVTDIDPDVIVIGQSKRMLQFASTARRVLRDTGHSVLVVPPTVPETRSIYTPAA